MCEFVCLVAGSARLVAGSARLVAGSARLVAFLRSFPPGLRAAVGLVAGSARLVAFLRSFPPALLALRAAVVCSFWLCFASSFRKARDRDTG
jgi:X-X-X-Leu-X-X-Gly heptad repeat protein